MDVAKLPTGENKKLQDMAYNLRPNSACSLSRAKNVHFRPLASGLTRMTPFEGVDDQERSVSFFHCAGI